MTPIASGKQRRIWGCTREHEDGRSFPSPSGGRWREAPDEGVVKVESVFITLTPNPSPRGGGEHMHV